MKLKDLMLWNKVRISENCDNKKLIGKVAVIVSLDDLGDCLVRTSDWELHEMDDDELEPILFDDEILHKNFLDDAKQEGNRINFHAGVNYDLEDGRKIWIGRWPNGITDDVRRESGNNVTEEWWEIVFYDSYGYKHGTKFRFVHELQNAFRLFGIEKIIKV